MKRFVKFAVAAISLISSVASAGVITSTYTNTGASDVINTSNPYNFTFDLTQLPIGYNAGVDTIGSASVLFTLKDTGPASNETFTFSVGLNNLFLGNGSAVPNSGQDYGAFSITNAPLSSLSNTGKVNVRITANTGEFRFVSSTLTADVTLGDDSPALVPEPLTLALMGIGLAGIATARRKS
jgi:hypothetical protein